MDYSQLTRNNDTYSMQRTRSQVRNDTLLSFRFRLSYHGSMRLVSRDGPFWTGDLTDPSHEYRTFHATTLDTKGSWRSQLMGGGGGGGESSHAEKPKELFGRESITTDMYYGRRYYGCSAQITTTNSGDFAQRRSKEKEKKTGGWRSLALIRDL